MNMPRLYNNGARIGFESNSNRIRIGIEPESFLICFERRRRAFFFTLVEARRDFANPQKQSWTALTTFSEGKEKCHDGDSNLHGSEKGLRRAHRPDWYLEPKWLR